MSHHSREGARRRARLLLALLLTGAAALALAGVATSAA